MCIQKKINKIALSPNDDKRIQSIDSVDTYAYGSCIDLLNENEEVKYNNIRRQKKMTSFHDYTNEYKTEHNSRWPHIPDHPYKIIIIGGSGSGKTNALN